MEESKKKPVMIGVTIVCFILAGVIYFATRPKQVEGMPDEFATQMVLYKCRNPSCEREWEISRKEKYEFLEQHRREHPGEVPTPGLACPGCGEQEGFEAAKCEKCGLVFEKGTVGRHEFVDRCPDCGYSKIEEERRKAAEAKRGGG